MCCGMCPVLSAASRHYSWKNICGITVTSCQPSPLPHHHPSSDRGSNRKQVLTLIPITSAKPGPNEHKSCSISVAVMTFFRDQCNVGQHVPISFSPDFPGSFNLGWSTSSSQDQSAEHRAAVSVDLPMATARQPRHGASLAPFA